MKHSLISNFRYAYGKAWQYSHKVLYAQAAEIIGEVLGTYITAALPAMVLYLLEHSAGIGSMAEGLCAAFVVVGAVLAFRAYFGDRNFFQYVNVRVEKMTIDVWRKSWEVSYAWRESEEGQNMLAQAQRAMMGNYRGFEGLFPGTTKLLNSLLGLIVFAASLTVLNPLLVAGVLFLSLVQVIVYRKALNYQWKHKEQRADIWRIQSYFQSLAMERDAGKDIRLYHLQKWISDEYDRVNREEKNLLTKEQGMFLLSDYTGICLELFRDAICYGYLLFQLTQGMDLAAFTLALGMVRGISTQMRLSFWILTQCWHMAIPLKQNCRTVLTCVMWELSVNIWIKRWKRIDLGGEVVLRRRRGTVENSGRMDESYQGESLSLRRSISPFLIRMRKRRFCRIFPFVWSLGKRRRW